MSPFDKIIVEILEKEFEANKRVEFDVNDLWYLAEKYHKKTAKTYIHQRVKTLLNEGVLIETVETTGKSGRKFSLASVIEKTTAPVSAENVAKKNSAGNDAATVVSLGTVEPTFKKPVDQQLEELWTYAHETRAKIKDLVKDVMHQALHNAVDQINEKHDRFMVTYIPRIHKLETWADQFDGEALSKAMNESVVKVAKRVEQFELAIPGFVVDGSEPENEGKEDRNFLRQQLLSLDLAVKVQAAVIPELVKTIENNQKEAMVPINGEAPMNAMQAAQQAYIRGVEDGRQQMIDAFKLAKEML